MKYWEGGGAFGGDDDYLGLDSTSEDGRAELRDKERRLWKEKEQVRKERRSFGRRSYASCLHSPRWPHQESEQFSGLKYSTPAYICAVLLHDGFPRAVVLATALCGSNMSHA